MDLYKTERLISISTGSWLRDYLCVSGKGGVRRSPTGAEDALSWSLWRQWWREDRYPRGGNLIIQTTFLHPAGAAFADGGKLFAAFPVRQPAGVERGVYEAVVPVWHRWKRIHWGGRAEGTSFESWDKVVHILCTPLACHLNSQHHTHTKKNRSKSCFETTQNKDKKIGKDCTIMF